MKISALRLHNVKRFAGKGVALENIQEGVNVFCAANEFGKSTSFEALHALFFQAHTSTAKDVRSLQPYSGGAPMVQADIVTGNGRYRLTKRFLSSKHASVTDLENGRLIAQADEAEQFISSLVRGGTAEPAGLLWVRQGVTGIDQRDKREEENEKRIRESLLTSVQGEVEAITGGRRMSAIIERCSEELSQLVTDKLKPKARGPYAVAIEERDRLVAEEQRLRGEVERLREALDQRAQIVKRLAVLEDAEEEASRRSAVEKATAVFEAAKAHREALKAAEAEARLAHSQLEKAEQDFVAFRTASKRSKELQAELATVEEERRNALARRNGVSLAMDKALSAAQAAAAEEQEARQLLQRLDAALKARQAAEELILLRERLQQAEALRASHEALKAELANLTLPAGLIDKLQKLEVEIAGLRAAKEASLPTLRMQYQPSATVGVTVSGKQLEDGAEQSFDDLVELEIAGAGTLILRSNRPADADAMLLRKEAERRKLLEAASLADLAEARAREASVQAKLSDLKQLELRLEHLAPEGLARLRELVAQRELLGASVPDVEGDPEVVRTRAAEAAQKLTDANGRIREAQPQRSRADDALMAIETRHAKIIAELTQVDSVLGAADARASREQSLEASYFQQKQNFEELNQKVEKLQLAAPDLAAAEAALQRARSVQDAANKEKTNLHIKLAELNTEIRNKSDEAVEEAWREAEDALAITNERVARFQKEVAVLVRLRSALQQSRSAARDLYLHPVIKELRPLLNLLFDDVSFVFDEKTYLPQSLRRNGQDESIEVLSGGMKEQLSILTRLAFARMLAAHGRPAPVILDDALVYSDDDRIEKMFDALHRQSRDQQIIVFSCRQRAFSKLGGNVLEISDWRPEA